MIAPRRFLPSVTSLLALEAVERLGSATLAAAELSVTHSAISRQLKHLEEQIGVALFQRSGRALTLTPAGRDYADSTRGYLQDLAPAQVASRPIGNAVKPDPGANPSGANLYKEHCASCHGEAGQGVPRAYPALAGSGGVNLWSPVNLIQIVLHGGFAPVTSANPRPFGMPPFALSLSDHEIATVLSFVRSAWGNRAPK